MLSNIVTARPLDEIASCLGDWCKVLAKKAAVSVAKGACNECAKDKLGGGNNA